MSLPAVTVLGGVGALLGSQIVEVAGDLPLYQTTIEKKVDVLLSASAELSASTSQFSK
jgi:hypothetical protein